METTTIKVYKKTKQKLDRVKEKNESYDAAIRRLLAVAKHKDLKEQLIEGYTTTAEEDRALANEWAKVAVWPK